MSDNKDATPSGEIRYPLGSGAVLYATTDEFGTEGELWHVMDVYHAEGGGGGPYVRMWDGTHTVDHWMHIDDVYDMFVPAGWCADKKPTYILTRKYGHEAYPKDLMTPQLYQ